MGFYTEYPPLRTLGFHGNSALRITEEQRTHIHIIGSTQQGKSKFIERLIRGDIKRGLGVCLLDPTTGGKTVYDVLRYCAYKKIKKVCLIDPYHQHEYNTITGISPFNYTSDGAKSDYLKQINVTDFMDTLRVLFNVKDPSDQMRIERYMPSVLSALYDAKRTLYDVKYFTNLLYKTQREAILDEADNSTRIDLEEAFISRQAYSNFQSTVNRLVRFFRGTIGMMFTPTQTVDFMKLISEGWIILVNLDSGLGFDKLDSRLLGTFIINQVTTCIERLNKKGMYKPYYLYIDEAAHYANRKLADMLSEKQKTMLKVTVSHQYTDQFEDKYVLNSVLANCHITAHFNLRMTKDRDLMSEQFYGGDIDPKDASYANSDLAVQTAVIKALKGTPTRVRIPNVETPPITNEQLADYIRGLYLSQAWYHNAKNLKEQLDDEFIQPTQRDDFEPSPTEQPSHNKTTRSTVKGKSAFSRTKQDGNK